MTHDSGADQGVLKDDESLAQAGERERILAAVGWEGDPRRRRVLRKLLQEHYQRIYLHCYAATHNRHSAMDGTRRALLGAARTLDQIPQTCPLVAWIFLELPSASRRAPECPEPWRVLVELNHVHRNLRDPQSRSAPEEVSTGPALGDLERHREVHPGCGDLLAAYRTFLEMPEDATLGSRAGWPAPVEDLDRFLEAQFGEENPQAVRPSDYWRQLLRSFRWSRSGLAGAIVILAAAVLAVVLLTEWQGRMFPRRGREASTTATTPIVESSRAVRPSGPELALISGASVKVDRSVLAFQWEPAASAQQYRLSILTAKLAGLHTVDQLTDCSTRISVREVDGLISGESCLFRVDGLKNGTVVASSGYQPFELP